MTSFSGGTGMSSGFLKKYLQYLNQRQATTGRAPTPQELQALMEAELSARQNENLQAAQLGQQRSQWNQEFNLKKQELSSANRAATIGGIGQLVVGGAQAYPNLKAAYADVFAKGASTGLTATAPPAFSMPAAATSTFGPTLAGANALNTGASAGGALASTGATGAGTGALSSELASTGAYGALEAGGTTAGGTAAGSVGLGVYALPVMGASIGSMFGKGQGKDAATVGGGIAGGAAMGATIGAAGGPIGAGVGAIIGGLVGVGQAVMGQQKEND